MSFSFIKKLFLSQSPSNKEKSRFGLSHVTDSKAAVKLDKDIGLVEAKCPYCFSELQKMPARKTKCSFCGKFIYCRTRPYDNKKILITEQQIESIEEQWAIYNGVHEQYLREREIEKKRELRIRERIRRQYGVEPTDEDVEFRILNEKATEFEHFGDWGHSRNARVQMAKNLVKRKSFDLALRMYFHVCFLDVNGPNNRSGTPKEFLSEFPYFTPHTAFIAPGIIESMKKLISKLGYSKDDLKKVFIEVTTPVHNGTPTPIPPDKVWSKLEKEF